MSFSNRMIDRADKLLRKYGRPMTLRRIQAGAYNPSTGQTAADTVTDYPCNGLIQFITRTSANQFYGTSTLQNSLIQKDDEMCFLSTKDRITNQTLSVVPQHPTDLLIVGNKTYSIMFVTILESQGNDIVYVLQLRK